MAGNTSIDKATFDIITREVCDDVPCYDTLLRVADSFADGFLYNAFYNGSNESAIAEVKNIFLIRVYREVRHSFYADGANTDKQPEELEKWFVRRATWAFTSHYQKQKKAYENLDFIIDDTPQDGEAPKLTPLALTSGSPEDAMIVRQDAIDNTERAREQVRRLVMTMLTSPSEPYIILACLAVDLYFAVHPDCRNKKEAENAIVELDYTLDELAEYDFAFLRGFSWLGDISAAEEVLLTKLDELQENGERLGDSRLSDFFGKTDGVSALSKWTYVQGKSLTRKLGLKSGTGNI